MRDEEEGWHVARVVGCLVGTVYCLLRVLIASVATAVWNQPSFQAQDPTTDHCFFVTAMQ